MSALHRLYTIVTRGDVRSETRATPGHSQAGSTQLIELPTELLVDILFWLPYTQLVISRQVSRIYTSISSLTSR